MQKSLIGGQYPDEVIKLIRKAQNSLDIIVYDWRWYPDNPSCPAQLFNYEVIKALQRGVKVRAIINGGNAMQFLCSAGARALYAPSAKTMHAKTLIIDQKIMVTGSHNFTQNGFCNNYEISILSDDDDIVGPIHNFLTALFANI